MHNITEGKLTIVFSSSNWKLKKYDDCETYTKHLHKTENLKAADIVAVHDNKTVYIIEIKDFSNTEELNLEKWDYNLNCLASSLSQKIKDTILGIFSTQRNETQNNELWDLVVSNFNKNNELRLVFWIDGNIANYCPRFHLNHLSSSLKRKLHCLNAKIITTNSLGTNLPDTLHEYC